MMTVCSMWIGISIWRFYFLIIMTKLNKNIISWLKHLINLFPPTFIYKTTRTSTIDRFVYNGNVFIKNFRQHLSPSTFRVLLCIGLISHCRIAYGINSNILSIGKGGKTEE